MVSVYGFSPPFDTSGQKTQGPFKPLLVHPVNSCMCASEFLLTWNKLAQFSDTIHRIFLKLEMLFF